MGMEDHLRFLPSGIDQHRFIRNEIRTKLFSKTNFLIGYLEIFGFNIFTGLAFNWEIYFVDVDVIFQNQINTFRRLLN